MEEENTRTMSDYLDILRRRKWGIIIPICILFLIAFILVLLLPPIYRSTSTILIEEQDIPADFVKTTVTGFAEQRLQTLNQRIMSSTKLLEIINRFGLYNDLRSKLTTEEIVDIMRKDINLTTISADVTDPRRGGSPSPVTIAFTLSYDGKNSQVVQQVANVLASLFLEENLKVREERASGASRFLEEEMKTVQTSLADVDAKIAKFKQQHVNELPELLQVNITSLDRVEYNMEGLRQQLRSLKEKEGYLQSQLLAVPTDAANQDRELLKNLKANLVQLQSKFSDKHPDVKKMKSEIAELEKRLDVTPARAGNSNDKGFSPLNQPDNPAYVNLASQLMSVRSEIDSIQRQINDKGKERSDYQRRLATSPKVEEAYKALLSERNNLQLKFDDLMKKTMEARVAQGLEKEQMGERFTIIDPARLPERPVKPNRPAILLIGIFLGIAAGVGTASLQEFNDQSVKNPKILTALTGLPVLITVPEIITEKDILQRKIIRKRVIIGIIVICIIGIICFHLFIMDLDILWAKISRRFF